MKKTVPFLIVILVAALVAGVTYLSMSVRPDEKLGQSARIRKIFEDSNCMACHSRQAEAPFYASFPIAGSLVKKDMADGVKIFDMDPVMDSLSEGAAPGKVALAKIETVIDKKSMPPLAYKAAHWGSRLSKKAEAEILQWISDVRRNRYSNRLAAEEFLSEPIQPIVDSIPVDPAKVQLGYELFHDTRLSSDNTISCASCHDLEKGGTDRQPVSTGVGDQKGGISAPTVYNAVFNHVQFWDGRAADLAEQAAGPPLNPIEMGNASFDEIIDRLEKDREFTERFVAVYPEGYSQQTITDAIAEFEKTLITPNSPFDRYLKGDKTALTADQIEGYRLFKDFQCATCHVGTLMGGQSFEPLGVHKDYFVDRGRELNQDDRGRVNFTKDEFDLHRFKVPTLRNIALTSPYFHDGRYATLPEAVEAMSEFQVGEMLTPGQIEKIVRFLESLTGEYQGKPL